MSSTTFETVRITMIVDRPKHVVDGPQRITQIIDGCAARFVDGDLASLAAPGGHLVFRSEEDDAERCARCGSDIDGPGNCLRRAEGCQGGRGESPTKRNLPTVLSARPQDADNDESIVNRHFGTPDEIAKLPFNVGREHLASRAAALILTRDLRDRVDKLEAVVRAADSLREKAAMRTLWRSEFATFDSLRAKIVLSEPKPEASDQQKTVRTPTTVNDNPHNIRRGPYLHYKGVLYWVEGLAEHADGSLLVVYRGPHNKDDHSVLSTRSLTEFTEHVETTSYSGPRFVHAWE